MPAPDGGRPGLQATQRVSGFATQRTYELAVVLVGHFARTVVELELLQSRERTISTLCELQLTPRHRSGTADALASRGTLS